MYIKGSAFSFQSPIFSSGSFSLLLSAEGKKIEDNEAEQDFAVSHFKANQVSSRFMPTMPKCKKRKMRKNEEFSDFANKSNKLNAA